jgi:HTH-type transcriptional regulator, transcriptional repressor of NAD biosynthesis genes
VLFLGAPSSGKTTLAKTLASRLRTEWMPEYGDAFWREHQVNRRLTPEQLVTIAKTHIDLEDQRLLTSNKYLFVDTSALITYHFALDYHGSALPELQLLAHLSESRYGHVFLCADDIPYHDTWDRSGEVHRADFQRRLKDDMKRRGIFYTELRGDVESRINMVLEVIG